MKFTEPRADDWTEKYRSLAASGQELTIPTETLVRLFKGNYVPEMPRKLAGLKAIDVGFGNGNNTMWLCSMGLDVAGVELALEITCAALSLSHCGTLLACGC